MFACVVECDTRGNVHNVKLISASHTTEQESEFGLVYRSEGRVTVVLCDTFVWALEPWPRAR